MDMPDKSPIFVRPLTSLGVKVMDSTVSASGGQTWRDFERLAARIYEELVPQGALVVHDDLIPGRLSGIPRQIDVSVRYEMAGHTFLTIVQAKDYSVPADVNTIGEFATVIEDVK